MAASKPIQNAIVVGKIAAVVAGGMNQPQSPMTQYGNYQKSSIPQTSAQVNTGRSNPTTSGK